VLVMRGATQPATTGAQPAVASTKGYDRRE